MSARDYTAQIQNRKAIVDRRRLHAEIGRLAGEGGDAQSQRAAVLKRLRTANEAGRTEIRRRFEEDGASGLEVVRAHAFLTDQLIRVIYDHVTGHLYPLANPSTGEVLSIAAVGGYGRAELAPHSDIDLLFLLPYKMTPRSEQVVEDILYFLWDLGFKVGHATRSIDDCIRLAKADATICTNMLEARWLWGDQELYGEFRRRYQKEVQAGGKTKFIEQKLAERDGRHKRLGDTRYQLEPNIKDGKGGLRDLHTLFWIAKFIYRVNRVTSLVGRSVFSRAEVNRFEKAESFLLTLRCHLHYLAGRPEERLTFDLQTQIAPRMGYTEHAGTRAVERFMKHYFLVAKDVGDLTRILCAAVEAEHNRRSGFRMPLMRRRKKIAGFPVEGDRITVADAGHFPENPVDMLRIFHVAQKNDLDIHPQALRWITRNLKHIDRKLQKDEEANRLFLEMLTSPKGPEITLRRMNEAGVLGRFVPDFGRVVSQMQFNMYHHYTVDEHTIFAIGVLHEIEQGELADEAPIATEVVHKVLSRRVLYVAVLLHDICKGRGGDHSELGAELAHKLCPRFGLDDEETETVAWLVLHHLAMSDTAFKRDLDDPKTIRDFADLVQSMERLRLLLVLTVADIRAVGPNVWNNWKAALLRDLYWRTEDVLSGGFLTEGRDARIEAVKEDLAKELSDWPKSELSAHFERGYPSYWLSNDVETLGRHARMIRHAERDQAPLTITTRVDRYREVTEVTIYTPDHPGLFSRIAGALAVSGASIDGARIETLRNGMALDTFWIRDAYEDGPFDRSDKLAKLSAAIERSLAGRMRPMQELEARRSSLPSRYRVFRVAPRVLIDNRASNWNTVIEVNGRDRPGLLYQLTLALTKLNLMIHSALISTYGERAVDVFYVQDTLGSKITGEAKLRRIRQRLLEALADPECQPARQKAEKKKPEALAEAATAAADSRQEAASGKARKPAAKKSGTKTPGTKKSAGKPRKKARGKNAVE